jgi:TPR repeat protein
MNSEPLIVQLNKVCSIPQLKSFCSQLLDRIVAGPDPEAAYVLALEEFGPVVSRECLESIGVIVSSKLYDERAFQSYYKSANEGSAHAARWVSHFYFLGLPPVEKDDALRAVWLAKAASLGDEISIGESDH